MKKNKNKVAVVDAKLTAVESKRYDEQLEIIDAAKQSFREMGNAIIDIASDKLWRRDYGTWAEFCELRVGLSVTQVKRLVDAAGAMRCLPKAVQDVVPSAKAAIRLGKAMEANPERTTEIVKDLVKEGPITETVILEHVPEPPKEIRKGAAKRIFDTMGFPIPPEARDLWDNRAESSHTHAIAITLWDALKYSEKSKSGLYCQADFKIALTAIAVIVGELDKTLLNYVCPECNGIGCDTCLNTGLLPKFVFDSLPKEILDARKQAIKDLAKEAAK